MTSRNFGQFLIPSPKSSRFLVQIKAIWYWRHKVVDPFPPKAVMTPLLKKFASNSWKQEKLLHENIFQFNE